jgi:catechol 2,3-dioxygenase-like lactoylglutathione lyase family enzyme
MKSCEALIIVDSIEEAVKFYTEKLGFDIVDALVNEDGDRRLAFARLRKGKCYIGFRVPTVEEFAEFSFIKRCASRCVSVFVEMKRGIDGYYARCKKRGLEIVGEPKDCIASGNRIFSVKDPFGIKLVFFQPLEHASIKQSKDNFCGMKISLDKATSDDVDRMVSHLKGFGILRRSAKKFAKLKIKEFSK